MPRQNAAQPQITLAPSNYPSKCREFSLKASMVGDESGEVSRASRRYRWRQFFCVARFWPRGRDLRVRDLLRLKDLGPAHRRHQYRTHASASRLAARLEPTGTTGIAPSKHETMER